jgi:hypothetical protein
MSAAIQEELAMQRNDERLDDALIDLGEVTQITKGKGAPEIDVLGGLQDPSGISND